ncbi:MAG: aldo/keto reductase [Acidobacteriota bacterium]|nr:aldo/keto reductase [Acidobacteriota bacterium]
MKYRTLGRTGYSISEIGFGAWGIGKQLWVGAEDSESLKALHRAVDQGLNFIDTALAYGGGHSETLVGQVLKDREERIFVATKVPPRNQRWPASGSLEEVFPRRHIIQSTETSLRNLGVETLDLLQLHVWSPSWIQDDQWFETLSQLKEEGKIAHFGISVNDHQPQTAEELVQTGRIDTIQVIYNVFEQAPEDRLFPLCREKEVGVIARVPFDEGALTGGITSETKFPKKDWRNFYFQGDRRDQVQEHVRELGTLLDGEARTLPELALKFCLHTPVVSAVIPGMRSVRHVEANLVVSDQGPLSEELMGKLRGHRWDKNFYEKP